MKRPGYDGGSEATRKGGIIAQTKQVSEGDDYVGEQGEPPTQNRYAYVTNNPVSMVDPMGRWGYRVHYTYTRRAARRLGFKARSKTIAEYDLMVDRSWRKWIPSYHFKRWGARFLARLFLASSKITGSLYDLGISLHAIQDSYAHGNALRQRPGKDDWMDNPKKNRKAYRKAKSATRSFLKEFRQARE